MFETIRLEDMRLFASVAEAKSFTRAARVLRVPKQTLSRRIRELEAALGTELMHRTTRRLELTDVGEDYARRCTELVRLADDANRAAIDAHDVPRGTLRVTADPVFGDAFLSGLVNAYAKRFADVRLEIVLTRRHVDLVRERFDVAFRIGGPVDASLTAIELGRARVRYCASPAYVARRGAPSTAADLVKHDCLVVSDGGPARWPMSRSLVEVRARHLFTSLSMARMATLAGLGVALFPEFACAEDLRRGRLVAVLGGAAIDVGSISLLHAARRFTPARVRTFVEMARDRFATAL